MKFKTGDRVVSIDTCAHPGFKSGATATVLTVQDDVVWIHPDSWYDHMPAMYKYSSFNGGPPYLRVFTNKLKKACMFHEGGDEQ